MKRESTKSEEPISVLTLNVGADLNTSPDAYALRCQPDILLLQECGVGKIELASTFPDHFLVRDGEYAVLAKWSPDEVDLVTSEGYEIALRCKIALPDTPIVVYSVHMPTRQSIFHELSGGGPVALLKNWFRTGIFDPDIRAEGMKDLAARERLLNHLMNRISQESVPVIIAGDFNMTDFGKQYEQVSAEITDTFAAAGRGYGHTVPGKSTHLFALYQPWLRLDYVWVSEHWLVHHAESEPERQSQHRAVFSKLTLVEP